MTMQCASVPAKVGSANEPLRLAAAQVATAVFTIRGKPVGWHPVIGVPLSEARAA